MEIRYFVFYSYLYREDGDKEGWLCCGYEEFESLAEARNRRSDIQGSKHYKADKNARSRIIRGRDMDL